MTKYQFLSVTVTRHNGTTFSNQLKLSEAHLISRIAQENKSILVELVTCTKKEFQLNFG